MLIGFWTINVFYRVSKLVFISEFHDSLSSTILSVFEITSCAFQLIALVILGSSIENESLESKHLVLTMPKENLHGAMSVKLSHIYFLLSALNNTRHHATITAWGMFKIRKNLLLIMFGTIITYKVLIVQIIERK